MSADGPVVTCVLARVFAVAIRVTGDDILSSRVTAAPSQWRQSMLRDLAEQRSRLQRQLGVGVFCHASVSGSEAPPEVSVELMLRRAGGKRFTRTGVPLESLAFPEVIEGGGNEDRGGSLAISAVDAGGRPVTGMHVWIVPDGRREFGARGAQNGTTGESHVLPTGTYRVSMTPFYGFAHEVTCGPVVVQSGSVARVDLRLPSRLARCRIAFRHPIDRNVDLGSYILDFRSDDNLTVSINGAGTLRDCLWLPVGSVAVSGGIGGYVLETSAVEVADRDGEQTIELSLRDRE